MGCAEVCGCCCCCWLVVFAGACSVDGGVDVGVDVDADGRRSRRVVGSVCEGASGVDVILGFVGMLAGWWEGRILWKGVRW